MPSGPRGSRSDFLIPCHRVIRETGALGGYRWGLGRKLAMIGWEAITPHPTWPCSRPPGARRCPRRRIRVTKRVLAVTPEARPPRSPPDRRRPPARRGLRPCPIPWSGRSGDRHRPCRRHKAELQGRTGRDPFHHASVAEKLGDLLGVAVAPAVDHRQPVIGGRPYVDGIGETGALLPGRPRPSAPA